MGNSVQNRHEIILSDLFLLEPDEAKVTELAGGGVVLELHVGDPAARRHRRRERRPQLLLGHLSICNFEYTHYGI